jgi:hypothetical protein
MANFFSLQDGNLTDASVYGYSLTAAEIMNNTTGVWLTTADAYGPTFIGDGSSISAVAVHLSSRQANNTTDSLILKLSAAGKSVQTETYPLSNFTSYDGSNNLLAKYPLNWQILKLSTGYQIPNLSSAKISLAATTSNTIALMCSASNNNFDKAIIASTATTPTSNDSLHLGGSIKLSATEARTIVASTSTFQNVYIHNQGILNFPLTSSKTLTLVGSAGLQITSDGTLNVGTSSTVIPLSTTHTIVLSNTQIDVHNGGKLNVYGYPKLFTTNLVNDTISGSNTFTTVDNVSGIWNVGDLLTFKPNLIYRNGFDTLTISSFTNLNTFTTTSASLFTHTGSATYANIAGVYNLNRNVIIQGLNSTARGTIRAIDAAETSINYAQLSNFGINSFNKTGLVLGNNLSGSTTLSGSVINSDNISTVNNIAPLTGRIFQNITINNNIINKSNTIALTSLSTNNVNISNNYILSSGGIGLQLSNLSGSISMSNNTTIGSLSYGTYIANNTLTAGTYGANNFNSLAQGMYVAGSNAGTIVGGGLNSAKEGVYVDASTNNLSGVTFQNILANNNSSVGFKVSGNSLNYLTPVALNINGLVANTNSDAGFEAYNITGNLSNIISNNNLSGSRLIIGNGSTIFDGISSTLSGTVINILSAINYNQTVIKNALLSSLTTPATALRVNVDKLEEFRLENSILSAATPLQISSARPKLEGSYIFHNSNSDAYGLSALALTGYQSDIFLESGIAVMRENGLSGNHYRLNAAGKVSYDKSIVHTSGNYASEKLEPTSNTIKLRSASKYIPIAASKSTILTVYVRKSNGYTGDAPRLILKSNSTLGYSDTVLATSVAANGTWELLSGAIPTSLTFGTFEVYVDCSGSVGCGSINIDDWDFS